MSSCCCGSVDDVDDVDGLELAAKIVVATSWERKILELYGTFGWVYGRYVVDMSRYIWIYQHES